jgi:hypothetical protein
MQPGFNAKTQRRKDAKEKWQARSRFGFSCFLNLSRPLGFLLASLRLRAFALRIGIQLRRDGFDGDSWNSSLQIE